MPELPEVEVLVRYLAPALRNRKITGAEVRRARTVSPISIEQFTRRVCGGRFTSLTRRGKYLVFELRTSGGTPLKLLGHLGMTGRMYVAPVDTPLPKHATVILKLEKDNFVFEDTRYFGKLTFDDGSLTRLGPEPLDETFSVKEFSRTLKRSNQAIKVKLLDQSIVAGIGNIYASEALFRARISPRLPARRLTQAQVTQLHRAIRETLSDAIKRGSTIPLNFPGANKTDALFYFGTAPDVQEFYDERLRVYDRAGKSCVRCRTKIKRIVQAARSTFYCPHCQKG